MNRAWTGIAAGALLAVACFAAVVSRHRYADIVVSINLSSCTSNACTLTVHMENRGRAPFTFNAAQAPWYFRASNVYTAVLAENSETRQRTPIAQWSASPIGLPAGPITIKRGEVRTNDLSLDLYYEDAIEHLTHGDIVLLWAYEPRAEDGSLSSPPVGGHLRIPRFYP